MNLNDAEREALLASADKHDEAATEIRVIAETLQDAGYTVHAKHLLEVTARMVEHVDAARDLARKS